MKVSYKPPKAQQCLKKDLIIKARGIGHLTPHVVKLLVTVVAEACCKTLLPTSF